MRALQARLPELAEQALKEARRDESLRAALHDLEKAYARLDDDRLDPAKRAHWTEICEELVAEIKRLTLRSSRNN